MPKYKLFSVIAIGSTAVNMKIFQYSRDDGISVVENVRRNISAGAEVYSGKRLSYGLVGEICRTLESCVEIMDGYGVTDRVCYAATAFREASNSEYFIDQADIRCGIKVNIISNEEEMFLHNKALALNLPSFDNVISGGALIVDVNSGNTQISRYSASKLTFSQSIPIGSLRVLEMFSQSSSGTSESAELLEEYIKTRLNNSVKSFMDKENCRIIAVGEHMELIKKISGVRGEEMSAEDFDRAYKILKSVPAQAISDEYRASFEDARLLFPALIIHRMFTAGTKEKIIVPSGVALADGMGVEFIEKIGCAHTNHIFSDDIISCAQYHARKYHADMEHYMRVAEFSEVILGALKRFGLSKKDMPLLRTAAAFADTGKYININGYNKYSFDILQSNPIIGIPPKNHEVISYVVLFQDGLCENDGFKYLPKNRKLLISKLASVLSLAKALDFGYNGNIEQIRAAVRNDVLEISARAKNGITLEQLEFEKRAEFFGEVFGIEPKLRLAKA